MQKLSRWSYTLRTIKIIDLFNKLIETEPVNLNLIFN